MRRSGFAVNESDEEALGLRKGGRGDDGDGKGERSSWNCVSGPFRVGTWCALALLGICMSLVGILTTENVLLRRDLGKVGEGCPECPRLRQGGGDVGNRLEMEQQLRISLESQMADCKGKLDEMRDRANAAEVTALDAGANVVELHRLKAALSEAEKRVKELDVELKSAKAVPVPPQVKGGETAPWLVIGIPTVPRANNVDYLNPTLNFILEQLPPFDAHGSLMAGRVHVVVMNNAHGRPHDAFETAKRRLATDPKGGYVEFVVNEEPAAPGRDRGTNNKPGAKVRQQSLDVVALLEHVTKLNPLPGHFMFMEDDFRLCPNALVAIQYLVHKISYLAEDWIMLRISYGLNGGLIRGTDVAAFRQHLLNRHRERPPDHILVEWYAQEREETKAYGKGRPFFASRYNLFEHLGAVSSLDAGGRGAFAGCYDLMDGDVLFEVEAFKVRECPHQDVWPCTYKGKSLDDNHVIPFAPLQRSIKRISKGVWTGEESSIGLTYAAPKPLQ